MTSPGAIVARACAALRRGDPREAELILASVWNAGPAPPADAVHLLGLIRRAQGRLQEAESLLRQSIALAPDKADYHSNLGLLLLHAGFAAPAAESFALSVRLNPKMSVAYVNWSRALLAAGDMMGAEQAARAGLQGGDDADIYVALGGALRLQGRHADSIAAFDTALVLAPGHVSARHDRAIALDRIGRSNEALDAYQALHQQGLRAASLFVNWAGVLLDRGEFDAVERLLREGLSHHPTDLMLHESLAKLRWLLGDRDGYVSDWEAALARSPRDLRLALACADYLRRGGHFKRAEALVRHCLSFAPQAPAVHAALGVLRAAQDDLALAEEFLTRAANAAPQDWALRESLVDVLLRAAKPDAAAPHISAARIARPLDQAWIGQEALMLRVAGNARYRALFDYDRVVRAFDLAPPAGFATIKDFNAALAQALRDMHRLKAHPIDQSLVGGTQTSRSLLETDDLVIKAFLAAVRAPIEAYIAAMPEDETHPLFARKSARHALVGCWSVRLAPGGYHVNHVHPEGWISSAYYVTVPEGVAGAADHQGWIQFGAPRNRVRGCDAEHVVEPRAGRLVLFPSYMWHGTVPFRDGVERLTIAFDVAPLP